MNIENSFTCNSGVKAANNRFHSDDGTPAIWVGFLHFQNVFFSECSLRENPAAREAQRYALSPWSN